MASKKKCSKKALRIPSAQEVRNIVQHFDVSGRISIVDDNVRVEVDADGKDGRSWTCTVEGQGALKLLKDVSEYGVIKKPQADLILNFVAEHKIVMNGSKLLLGGKSITNSLKTKLALLQNSISS